MSTARKILFKTVAGTKAGYGTTSIKVKIVSLIHHNGSLVCDPLLSPGSNLQRAICLHAKVWSDAFTKSFLANTVFHSDQAIHFSQKILSQVCKGELQILFRCIEMMVLRFRTVKAFAQRSPDHVSNLHSHFSYEVVNCRDLKLDLDFSFLMHLYRMGQQRHDRVCQHSKLFIVKEYLTLRPKTIPTPAICPNVPWPNTSTAVKPTKVDAAQLRHLAGRVVERLIQRFEMMTTHHRVSTAQSLARML